MKLTKYEQETIICYNGKETTASVYTHNKKRIQKLKRLSEKYPDKEEPERPEHRGAVSYLVPKRCVFVRELYSERRREADSLRAKAAKI